MNEAGPVRNVPLDTRFRRVIIYVVSIFREDVLHLTLSEHGGDGADSVSLALLARLRTFCRIQAAFTDAVRRSLLLTATFERVVE